MAFLLAALMLLAPALAAVTVHAQPITIKIGALLPLTGDLQSYGVRAQAAVQVAIDEMNQYLEQQNAPFRLDVVIEDTQTKPDIATQKFNSLVAQGIKFIVGPMTSAEVKSVKDLANSQNVLVISPSSTAISLAIPGDNVFRFCPADDVQSKAIGALAQDLGIKAVVIINRADTWGEGLKDATKEVLQSKGVTVKNVYSYDPENPQFGSIANSAYNDVKDLLNSYPSNQVAVVVIGFNEVAQLFKSASNYPELGKVLWIGSDGTALLNEIVSDPLSAQFAEQVLFINPIFSPAKTSVQQQVADKIKQLVNQEPDAYALAAHDAVVALALAILDASNSGVDLNNADALVNYVKQKLPDITQSDQFGQFAATGKFPLNDAGDRATADYDLWVVMKNESGSGYKWVKVGQYKGLEDKVVFEKLPNGKTFKDLFNERFQAAATTTAAEKKGNTGLIVGAIIVIIIIIAIAWLASRRKA